MVLYSDLICIKQNYQIIFDSKKNLLSETGVTTMTFQKIFNLEESEEGQFDFLDAFQYMGVAIAQPDVIGSVLSFGLDAREPEKTFVSATFVCDGTLASEIALIKFGQYWEHIST